MIRLEIISWKGGPGTVYRIHEKGKETIEMSLVGILSGGHSEAKKILERIMINSSLSRGEWNVIVNKYDHGLM